MNNLDYISKLTATPEQEYRQKVKSALKLIRFWEKTGLLEGLNSEHEKYNMALALENQAKQLLKESSMTGRTPGSEEWAGVALPVVRKVFGEVSSKEFISFQTLSLPTSLIFYVTFEYGTTKPGFSKEEEIFGVTNKVGQPQGGLYGAGRFGYSLRHFEEVITSGTSPVPGWSINVEVYDSSATTPNTQLRTRMEIETNFVQELSGLINSGNVKRVEITMPKKIQGRNPDVDSVRAFRLEVEQLNPTTNEWVKVNDVETLPAYSMFKSISSNSVTIVMYVLDNRPNAVSTPLFGTNTRLKLHFVTNPFAIWETDVRTDFELRDGETMQIPEINMTWKQLPLTAKSRKLKSVWTPEFEQHINSYQQINAEAELTAIMAEYIGVEIDLENFDMLMQYAATKEYWSAQIGEEIAVLNPGTANEQIVFNTTNPSALAPISYTKESWFKTLAQKVQLVSNFIMKKTLRGEANVIMTSPEIATVFETLPGFVVEPRTNAYSFNMGTQLVGTFLNKYKIFKNPYMLENVILLGYKGSFFLETGAVYGTYIPFITTPVVLDQENFTPRKGIWTSYAKKMIRPEFYGKIIVAKPHLI